MYNNYFHPRTIMRVSSVGNRTTPVGDFNQKTGLLRAEH